MAGLIWKKTVSMDRLRLQKHEQYGAFCSKDHQCKIVGQMFKYMRSVGFLCDNLVKIYFKSLLCKKILKWIKINIAIM